eukprot:GHRR01030773.1.p1 GENE.GHRR01030773.1~~GHRR01030773.1.p1  ORF type:complete len:109 (-),score=5.24 GHRR01030773.1:62-388(-)
MPTFFVRFDCKETSTGQKILPCCHCQVHQTDEDTQGPRAQGFYLLLFAPNKQNMLCYRMRPITHAAVPMATQRNKLLTILIGAARQKESWSALHKLSQRTGAAAALRV